MGNIERRFREIGEMRGRGSEQLVGATLEMMVQKREIDEFERIEPRSELDYRGIDFFVIIKGKRFPLQVKSSRRGLKEARKEHPEIPAIRARPGDPIEKIHRRLKTELGQARARYRRKGCRG